MSLRIGVLWPQSLGYLLAGLSELCGRGHRVSLLTEHITEDDNRRARAAGIAVSMVDGRGDTPDEDLDLLLVCGWHRPAFRAIADRYAGRCPRVLYFDTQWSGSLRQRLGQAVAERLLHRRFEYCFVPGPAQADFARRVGFEEHQIRWGALTHEADVFSRVRPIAATGLAQRRRFLFAGRLVPEKGLDVLLRAHRDYARASEAPWSLAVAGVGPLRPLVESAPQVEILGHLGSESLGREMEKSACLVLPSRYEPYGVIVQEAAAAGLPVIATPEVGAVADVMSPGLSGILCAGGDPAALAEALTDMASRSSVELARMGEIGRQRAAGRTPAVWASSLVSVVTDTRTALGYEDVNG